MHILEGGTKNKNFCHIHTCTKNIISYVWRIKNKYYSAQVNLDIETNFSNIGESGKQATAVVYFGGKIQTDDSGETLIDSLERWHKAILPQGIQDRYMHDPPKIMSVKQNIGLL